MKFPFYLFAVITIVAATGCKKKGCTDPTALNYSESAKKDDGSCSYSTTYAVPSTYNFTNSAGNSTVDFSGQSTRLEQLRQLIAYAESGESAVISAQSLKDMFQNTGGNGGGLFTGAAISSSKQLKDKCFALDVALIESYLDSSAAASINYATPASNGQSGTLTSGASTYLFSANGFDCAELIEKGIMGAVLEYQALNVYFSDSKMNVDNTVAVDPANGQYYTAMQHHWDEAFGYFGVPVDFPTTPSDEFWGEYCMNQNATLSSNAVMMDNFLKGRAAIVNSNITDRNTAILNIREMWENIAAYQAMSYINSAIGYFGNDQAKYLHNLTEAYAFIYTLRYAPIETRNMTTTEVDSLIASFGGNLWTLTVQDLNTIKATLDAKY